VSYIYLSHILDAQTPGFGGNADFKLELVRKMCEGGSCNSSRVEVSMHLGTHVDAPYHFCESGDTVETFRAQDWIFKHVSLVHLEDVLSGTLIGVGSWCEKLSTDTELILLKTGFEKYRNSPLYWQENPGIHAELGVWLRKHRPSVRVLGFDFISASSFTNREMGRTAHKAFLCKDEANTHPILFMEDLSLCELEKNPEEVIALPLRVRGADGAPMTIIARMAEEA